MDKASFVVRHTSTGLPSEDFVVGIAEASAAMGVATVGTYTWPTNFGSAGTSLTDAAGNGTLSWAAGGITVGKTIAMTMIFGG